MHHSPRSSDKGNDTGVWTGDYCDVFEENSSLQSIFGLLFAVVIALLAIFITCVILLNKRGQKQLHEKGLGSWLNFEVMFRTVTIGTAM